MLGKVEARAIGKLYAAHARYDQWRDQFLANAPKAFEPADDVRFSAVSAASPSGADATGRLPKGWE